MASDEQVKEAEQARRVREAEVARAKRAAEEAERLRQERLRRSGTEQ